MKTGGNEDFFYKLTEGFWSAGADEGSVGGNQFQKWNAARESAEWEGGEGGKWG